ncbi:MAG: exosortase T [Acidobacteriota bacterium]
MTVSTTQPQPVPRRLLVVITLVLAVALAAEPLRWLLRSWTDPTLSGTGPVLGLLVGALLAWSLSSPLRSGGPGVPSRRTLAWWLLALSALVRLTGHAIHVNVLSALTLPVDLYALGVLGRLSERSRALSPGWLAVLFAASLPIERILQRVLGFAFQLVSARGASVVLDLLFEPVERIGTSLLVEGREVLVDLPCSGSTTLFLLVTSAVFLATVLRPRPRTALALVAASIVLAYLGNTVRIALLAIGLVRADALGFDVMEAPWHELVGLVSIALAAGPLLWWALRQPTTPRDGTELTDGAPAPAAESTAPVIPSLRWLPASCSALALLGLLLLPRTTVDASRPMTAPELPRELGGFLAEPLPLTPDEESYFAANGGGAAKARYGEQVLVVVRSTSPLRHLHAPDQCLRGLGQDVRYLGRRDSGTRSAFYRAVDRDGTQRQVRVSFVGESGTLASSIGEVAWHWLHGRDRTWTSLERVAPWGHPHSEILAFDRQLAQVFDIPPSPFPTGDVS